MTDYQAVWDAIPQNCRNTLDIPMILKEVGCRKLLYMTSDPELFWRGQTWLTGLRKAVQQRMLKGSIESSDVIEPLYGFLWQARESTDPKALLDNGVAFLHKYLMPSCPSTTEVWQLLEGTVNFSDEGYLFQLIRNVADACVSIETVATERWLRTLSPLDWEAIAAGGLGQSDAMQGMETRLKKIHEFVTVQDPDASTLLAYITHEAQSLLMDNMKYCLPNTGFFDLKAV